MQNTVSITSQGQLTIPKAVRKLFGILGSTKATIRVVDDAIIVKPKKDFWSLEGSLASDIKLTDKQLKEVRKKFETAWAQE
ncbi:MAG: AbrB/MazE/SpoVT family DNA-binding domain-containing protein [bacterium]|nr:AbrB/MazE/SpoVT family DNA-binding domain-containing protein [bacterium]